MSEAGKPDQSKDLGAAPEILRPFFAISAILSTCSDLSIKKKKERVIISDFINSKIESMRGSTWGQILDLWRALPPPSPPLASWL